MESDTPQPRPLVLDRRITFAVQDRETGATVKVTLSGLESDQDVTPLKSFDWSSLGKLMLGGTFDLPASISGYQWSEPETEVWDE